MALCAHSSHLDASQLTQWYLASHPFNMLQPTHHLCCHCYEASKKKGFCACLAPILPLVMHPLSAAHEESTAPILPVIPPWRWCHC